MNGTTTWLLGDFTKSCLEGLLSLSVLLTIVALVAASLARRRPTRRHALWSGTLVTIIAYPILSAGFEGVGIRAKVVRVPSWLLRVEPRQSTSLENPVLAPGSLEVHSTSANSTTPSAPPRSQGAAPPSDVDGPSPGIAPRQSATLRLAFIWLSWLTWGGGVCLLIARLAVGWVRTKRLIGASTPLDIHVRRAVSDRVDAILGSTRWPPLACSRLLSLPCVVGLFRPTVVLPGRLMETIDDDTLVRVLVHEIAHVRRGDPWVLRLQRLVTVPLWFHPLVHWMNRELDRAREEICDNYVIRDCPPADYARTLLRLAEGAPTRGNPVAKLCILDREHSLVFRIRCLLDSARDRSTTLAVRERLAVALIITGLSISTSIVRVQSSVEKAPRDLMTFQMPGYEFTDLVPQFRPQAMNERRQIVGRFLSTNYLHSRAAVWSAERGLEKVGLTSAEDATDLALCAINDHGAVAGYGMDLENRWRPFAGLPEHGLPRVPDLGGNQARASAINNNGQVVGWSGTSGHRVHWQAFLFTPGEGTRSLGTLGGSLSQASAINDKGWVVGYSEIQDETEYKGPKTRPFLWRPDHGMVSLGALEEFSDYGEALDINEHGLIVGSTARITRRKLTKEQGEELREELEAGVRSHNSEGRAVTGPKIVTLALMRPFRWSEDTGMTALPYPPGFDSVRAVAINNRGTVLLQAYDLPPDGASVPFQHGKQTHFLLTPAGIERLPNRKNFELTWYLDIKDDGSLVGYASNLTSDLSGRVEEAIQGFIAIPVQ
ncbi:MAG: M56 family metallopeptidase [Limisphaerales bacterium]